MDNEPQPLQLNRATSMDSLHSKAVNSLHKNTVPTEPCQEFLLCAAVEYCIWLYTIDCHKNL